jgi:hypothetical protein
MTVLQGWASRVLPGILVFFGLGWTEGPPAQESLEWEDFDPCETCELSFTRYVAFGERDGPGVIESELARVVARGGRGYLVFGQGLGTSHRIARFSDDGRFLGSIGRYGDGPGEIRTIADVAFLGEDRVLVLDLQNRRWITFRDSGEVVFEAVLPGVLPGRFRVVEGDTAAVIGVLGRQPESVGYPLHLAVLRAGSAVAHFGAHDPSWSVSDLSRSSVVLGENGGRARSVWWGYSGRPHFEQWSLDGSPLRVITGDLSFFPVTESMTQLRSRGSPPRSSILGVVVDASDRLWILSWVPGARWRTVAPQGVEGAIPEDQLSTYYDTRLDVFDLSERRHLGSKVWDSVNVTLVERDGAALVSLVEFPKPDWPQVVLYTIEAGRTP